MKNIFVSLAFIFVHPTFLFAATLNTQNGDLFQGEELINEGATGRACYLYVDYVEENPIGKHCLNLAVRPVFTTDRDLHPKEELTVTSRVTNYHRAEFPQIKTCAMNTNGKTSGDEIYGDDDTDLYNQIFSWEGKVNGHQFDFFVTLSPDTKLPIRTRLHKLNWFSEKNYDCVNLHRL